jgi:hypothetical protein
MNRKNPADVVAEVRAYFDLKRPNIQMGEDHSEGPFPTIVQHFHPTLGGWGPNVLVRLDVSAVKEMQRQGFTAFGAIALGSSTAADFQLTT